MELYAPAYVVLIVADLERALEFYSGALGLSLGHRSGPYAQFETGFTRFSLFEREAMQATLDRALELPASDAPAFQVGFRVVDVDEAFAELVAWGAPAVTPPRDRPWGQRSAYVRDPDGNLVELVQDPREG